MINALRRKGERGFDVVELKIRKVCNDLGMRETGGEEIEDIDDTNAQAPNTRAAAEFAGLGGDAVEEIAHS